MYTDRVMNDTSLLCPHASDQSFLLFIMPLYMAIWQKKSKMLQNMADVGYHIIGTDIPHIKFCLVVI